MNKIAIAAALAERTSDAYSSNRYGESGWRGAAAMLLRRGFNERQAEAILRSKWTRWAADQAGKRYGHTSGADLARFLDGMKNLKQEVDALVLETFRN